MQRLMFNFNAWIVYGLFTLAIDLKKTPAKRKSNELNYSILDAK